MLGERGANALICITGDLHGDFNRLCTPELKKLKSRDVLIVCGDFGFVWDGSKEEQKILKKIGKHRYDTLFVEGCHDNYDLLKEYPVVAYKGGKARKISGNLYQLMRGEIYEIDGRSVFAFGGGDSKDQALDLSQEGKAFWEEEQPSVQETQHALGQLAAHRNRVDLVVTHDAVSYTHLDYLLPLLSDPLRQFFVRGLPVLLSEPTIYCNERKG